MSTLNRTVHASGQTFLGWLAVQFRAIADRYDPPIKRTSVYAVAAGQLYDAQIALLDAEAEKERADHTVKMLTERVARLTSSSKPP